MINRRREGSSSLSRSQATEATKSYTHEGEVPFITFQLTQRLHVFSLVLHAHPQQLCKGGVGSLSQREQLCHLTTMKYLAVEQIVRLAEYCPRTASSCPKRLGYIEDKVCGAVLN